MYCFEGRARFSEVDRNNKLWLGAIIDYFQDCSTFNSEDLGMGMEYVQQQGLGWILSSWQIDIKRYHKIGDRFDVVTFPYEFKGFLGHRNYYIADKNGEKTAVANSLWTLLDMKKMRPVKIDDRIQQQYGVETKLDMEYLPRKIGIPKDIVGVEKESVLVRRYHLDSNQHMNNGQYVKIALEYIPEDFVVRRMRTEYKNSAKLGDFMVPIVYNKEKGYVVTLCDSEKKIYAVVEFE